MMLFTVPLIIAWYMVVETIEGSVWFVLEGARLLGSMMLWAAKRHMLARRIKRA